MTRDETLTEALADAASAPPESRIEYRDAIAEHGVAAVEAVAPWLTDPTLAAFATRTIARAAESGAREEALAALRRALKSPISESAAQDLQGAIAGLGGTSPQRQRPST
jgi:hypothetical protein